MFAKVLRDGLDATVQTGDTPAGRGQRAGTLPQLSSKFAGRSAEQTAALISNVTAGGRLPISSVKGEGLTAFVEPEFPFPSRKPIAAIVCVRARWISMNGPIATSNYGIVFLPETPIPTFDIFCFACYDFDFYPLYKTSV